MGGVYYFRSSHEAAIVSVHIRHVNSRAEIWPSEFVVDSMLIPTCGVDGLGGFLIGDEGGKFWRFDSARQEVWHNPVVAISDPENIYFPVIASDNNGGMIIAFWTTRGGIFVQHSGRNGQVGVITAVPERHTENISRVISVSQNYPNPFNSSTSLRYSIVSYSFVSIEVFDVLGRSVEFLINEWQHGGDYTAKLDGARMPSGIYYCRICIDGVQMAVKKVVLLK
jgi:hypothetical protein